MIDISKLEGISCKWPQCVIIGKKLTKEQAREVIIKTDVFFTSSWSGGNDEKYDIELRKRLNMPSIYEWNEFGRKHNNNLYEQNDKWRNDHGCLELNHLSNNWISSCYIGGPNGWCHVDGTIHRNNNIGKWPDWSEVVVDLQDLGREFPFLDITVYIIDCESCCGWDDDKDERKCLGGIHLCNGNLEIVDPIDPFSDVCKPINIWNSLNSESLKKEVASVVTPVEKSYYNERCPNEHIFRIEEAVEYFGEI